MNKKAVKTHVTPLAAQISKKKKYIYLSSGTGLCYKKIRHSIRLFASNYVATVWEQWCEYVNMHENV